ncbi:neutral/alkaline non-lysosomal ceramidase [Drepanopeziza brunnea f. sp. 'multigermtubi' MB_m1]|uniref:Neutral ceramidase n=1 Tax=Marssonina brunnea f. sp. multigermtubi (strain MB_m1) TaxID=1072389 RepID=K1X7H2_MARBU|nr:neutral/alkaline non-lysosomal ceramidase [Drepanopeziza brunnea f. sp. 'multigermtubi' MB_m1]EKD16593.1 neutral/alkaline non-lysosomal ceramidase [Drepanopeziza brunnea f. sp. 'multigermtubi' MB_m1]
MEKQSPELKAGPSASEPEPEPEWSSGKESSQWRRQKGAWLKALAGVVIVLLGCATLKRCWGNSSRDGLHGKTWSLDASEETSGKGSKYLLGVGKADITGPVVEINMMGYADPDQVGSGLRQRLYSRAFIVGDLKRPEDRFLYLVLDTQSGDTAVRYGILEGLSKLGPEFSMYAQSNVAVTGTHSHSGPGAWLNYLLPQITSKGFDKQSYRAIVNGAILSIERAHRSLQPGYLSVGSTKVYGANINRSLYSYLANPESERAKYNESAEDDGSVEKTLTLLRFQRASDGKNTGVLTWFPTHGTSMLGNNTLISGDNKGVAADLFEKSFSVEDNVADGFVAGFSQANVGDTSPNVLGAWCEDGSGKECSFRNSTCSNGRSQFCHARGPFFRVKDNGASSCYEIGKRQFEPARALYDHLDEKGIPISGSSVKSFHTFQDMSNFSFPLANGSYAHTCPAALGYSFAAGTSDGPGAFDFTQNDPESPSASPVWRVVSGLIKEPTEAQKRCHYPKPILLDVGELQSPYLWTPNVVDIQVLRVGQFVIIVSPGEATTMAGRRWKEAIQNSASSLTLSGSSSVDPVVVIGGPANSYTHYIATPEEYGIQRYEGASTLYGPHTLNAYINLTLSYLPYLAPSSTSRLSPGPSPPNNVNRSLSFITGVVYDRTPYFKTFGAVKTDVRPAYTIGDVVSATFVGANPRNSLRLEETYAAIEKLVPEPIRWERVRDDSDWALVFSWKRTSKILGTSEVQILWETEEWAEAGRYRIRYFGDAKAFGGTVTAFEGMSAEFVLA